MSAATCYDGIQNGVETGIDCGGSCGSCANVQCTMNADCSSRNCIQNACARPTCTDGIQNGVETS
ncbi:unnamed protein product, partial [Adineta steineri]